METENESQLVAKLSEQDVRNVMAEEMKGLQLGHLPVSSSSPTASEDDAGPCAKSEMFELVNNKLYQGESHNQEERTLQIKCLTAEAEMNTEDDWETVMRSLQEYREKLTLQYQAVLEEQEAKRAHEENQISLLEKNREDAIQKQQAIIDKIDSLRVKLKLNCCKTTRKNFASKKQELIEEKDKLKNDTNRLIQDLDTTQKKLALLETEHSEEKERLQNELAQLHKKMDNLQKEAEEAQKAASQNELLAFKMQKEVTISPLEDWIADAEGYIASLRSDRSQQHNPHRLEWENNVAAVRIQLEELLQEFDEQYQLLHQGRHLDSLRSISLPPLAQVPLLPPTSSMAMQNPARAYHGNTMPNRADAVPQRVVAAPESVAKFQKYALPPVKSSTAEQVPAKPPNAAMRPTVTTPSDNAQPVGKLNQVLDKLAAHFPRCSRNQLTSILQQIKTSRGTMAGLSMEELFHNVAQILEEREKPKVSVTSRKLCMICQNQVDPGSQHRMNCAHVVHKKCISMWLQSSQNNSCPFCPSK